MGDISRRGQPLARCRLRGPFRHPRSLCPRDRRPAATEQPQGDHRLLIAPDESTSRQRTAPYFDALTAYLRTSPTSFHVPGHQFGRGAPEELVQLLESAPLAGDITQILGMDDIHRPVSVCGEAQRLAADLWGAERSYFLVNGSTVGNQAMLMAAARPGQRVLLPRNAHRSLLAGALLADLEVAFYRPAFDLELGVAHAADLESLLPHLAAEPKPAAVVLTSPTYYGACAPLATLIPELQSRGLTVLVDEAWGAHFGFHPELPDSAVRCGADLVVQSTHKMASGMTQTAMLHQSGPRIDPQRLEAILRLLQSTSPSPLFLASLDCARRQLALEGRTLLGRTLSLADRLRADSNALPGVRCPGSELLSRRGVAQWDRTRLLVQADGWTGYEMEAWLRNEKAIQVEMAEQQHVLLVLTLGHRWEDCERLLQALAELPPRHASETASAQRFEEPNWPTERVPATLRTLFEAPKLPVPLERAVGAICGEILTIYPPGIPLVLPGERFTPAVVARLQRERAAGAPIEGAADPTLSSVLTVDARIEPKLSNSVYPPRNA